MIVVYHKHTGEIIYTVDYAYDPSFINLPDNAGILVTDKELGGKVRNMMVDLSGTPKLINKPSEV